FNCNPKDPTNMCPGCLARFESGEELPSARSPMRIVQVPLSVTDDRFVGSIDMDRAMEEGVRAFQPGLLAEVNQNILYIDEVNLLPDHITDMILDAAASGWNVVEREGISVSHPSRFILVGTMNPEEGDLRPQILDRFGIYAETENIDDLDMRALAIQNNEEFIKDPSPFFEGSKEGLSELHSQIEAARVLLSKVEVSPEIYSMVADVCSTLRVDGFRPDIVALKVAKALAAFRGRTSVVIEDVAPSIDLALGHRTRRSGLAPPPSPAQIREAIKKAGRREFKIGKGARAREVVALSKEFLYSIRKAILKNLLLGLSLIVLLAVSFTYILETLRSAISPVPLRGLILFAEVLIGAVLSIIFTFFWQRRRKEREEVLQILDLSELTLKMDRRLTTKRSEKASGAPRGADAAKVMYGKGFSTTPDFGMKILKSIEGLQKGKIDIKPGLRGRAVKGSGYSSGRRMKTVSSSSKGRFAGYQQPKGNLRDIALVPTIRAAALHQSERRGPSSNRLVIKPQDVKVKVREYRAPFSIVLLVDMSLSMINSVNNLIQAIYTLHGDVYRQRDRVGLIVFKGSKAFTIQHPTTNLDLVVKKLRSVGASDFTPMASGLLQALKVLKQEKLRNRDSVPNLIVFSDGIVNVPLERPLSPLTRRRYLSEAQADSIDAARLLAKEKYKIHIINTDHSRQEAEAFLIKDEGWRLGLTPTQFLMELARISKGNYYGLSLGGEKVEGSYRRP
ncbi:MAG: VWA domain-containing protein, partial [Candidatus Bathyarchaeia archaeon]